MPMGKHDESTKENEAQRTDYELTLPPEEECAECSYTLESFLKVIHREYTRRSRRISNLYDHATEGSAVLENATSVIEPTSLSNTLSYSRSEKENDSIWLFKVLDNIGVNDGYRKICRENAIIQEITNTFTLGLTVWSVGSCCEGTRIPGKESDGDCILCHEELIVIENISIADIRRASLLIVRDSNTPAGLNSKWTSRN